MLKIQHTSCPYLFTIVGLMLIRFVLFFETIFFERAARNLIPKVRGTELIGENEKQYVKHQIRRTD